MQKAEKKLSNKAEYGLPRQFYKKIVLPLGAELKVFNVNDVTNHKKAISTIERLRMLTDIEEHLLQKIENVKANEKASKDN